MLIKPKQGHYYRDQDGILVRIHELLWTNPSGNYWVSSEGFYCSDIDRPKVLLDKFSFNEGTGIWETVGDKEAKKREKVCKSKKSRRG